MGYDDWKSSSRSLCYCPAAYRFVRDKQRFALYVLYTVDDLEPPKPFSPADVSTWRLVRTSSPNIKKSADISIQDQFIQPVVHFISVGSISEVNRTDHVETPVLYTRPNRFPAVHHNRNARPQVGLDCSGALAHRSTAHLIGLIKVAEVGRTSEVPGKPRNLQGVVSVRVCRRLPGGRGGASNSSRPRHLRESCTRQPARTSQTEEQSAAEEVGCVRSRGRSDSCSHRYGSQSQSRDAPTWRNRLTLSWFG